MVRQIASTHDNPIIAVCPNCKSGSKLFRATVPQIDSCCFESYSFQCKRCKSSLAGIIDPMNEELLVSLLEPTSWCEHSSPERADYQTAPLIGYVKKFILMILVSKRRPSPPHGDEDEGADLLR
jgi:hypothetical protein